MKRMTQQAIPGVIQCDARFIAGSFNAEYEQGDQPEGEFTTAFGELLYNSKLSLSRLTALFLRFVFVCIASVIFPSTVISERNKIFMTTIKVKENEPFEVAMRRFKRTIEKSGLLTELRAREFYEKPTAERKRKLAAAVKRTYKRLRSQLLPPKLY